MVKTGYQNTKNTLDKNRVGRKSFREVWTFFNVCVKNGAIDASKVQFELDTVLHNLNIILTKEGIVNEELQEEYLNKL